MINRSLNDKTQLSILPHIQETENLITKAIRETNNGDGYAEITAMPDLGISSNAIRMNGGFFTGMYIKWESKIPFVPIDTTVNSCGVSVYTLNDSIGYHEFIKRIEYAKNNFHRYSFNWNFERGNHFIILGKTSIGKPCAVFHASADEYKQLNKDNALYPSDTVWYKDYIKAVESENGRYLRYICGAAAEKFISIGKKLSSVNKKRMDTAAELIFGSMLEKQLLYTSHYGMPDDNSVAIGCSWSMDRYALLTSKGNNIYIVTPHHNAETSKYCLNPHGFGVELSEPQICYDKKGHLYINNTMIENESNVRALNGRSVRYSQHNKEKLIKHIKRIFTVCPGEINEIIYQLASVSADGIIDFDCDLSKIK